MIGVSFYGDFLATAGWAWALVNKAGKLLVGALGTVPGCLAQSAAVAEHYAVYHLRSVATGGLRVVTDCKGVVSNWARGDSYARRDQTLRRPAYGCGGLLWLTYAGLKRIVTRRLWQRRTVTSAGTSSSTRRSTSGRRPQLAGSHRPLEDSAAGDALGYARR